MKTRVLSAALLLPIVLAAMVLGGWFYSGLIGILIVIASIEYGMMLKRHDYRPSIVLIALISLAWQSGAWWEDRRIQNTAVAAMTLATAAWALYQYQESATTKSLDRSPGTVNWALTMAGGIYLGLSSSYLIRLRALSGGLGWTLITLFVVWISDSAAYFVGKPWGRHKIAPAISPGKSWEGYAAQVISGILSGGGLVALWALITGNPVKAMIWQGLALGALLSAFSTFGDFFISMIKREVGAKDTSHLIPGHGGVLDRLDSPLWAGVLAFVFLTFVG